MNIPANYRKPILIAVILHVAILLVLIINLAPKMFRMPPSSAPMQTIHAAAISETAVVAEEHQVQQRPNEQAVAAEQQQQKQAQIQKQKAVEKQHQLELIKIADAKKQAEAKTQASIAAQLKAQQQLEKEKQLKQEKLKQEKIKAQKLAALKVKQAKAKKLMTEQKQLQQQLMQQQINGEQKNISQAQTLAQQGAIDKYKAEILASIQSNWRIDQVNSKLKCVYSVSLAPDGTVLSLQLVKSSGDEALDQSAKQAISLASPLPVPHDPALFDHFRQLVLTLSPQGILQSVSNS